MQGSRHKGRLFYSYLLSFLLILIVPVVFSALVFNRARSILNAEAGRANELLLQQMKSFLDTVMGDVVQLNAMITNHITLGGMLFESLPVPTTSTTARTGSPATSTATTPPARAAPISTSTSPSWTW